MLEGVVTLSSLGDRGLGKLHGAPPVCRQGRLCAICERTSPCSKETSRSPQEYLQSQRLLGPRVPSGLNPFSNVCLLQCHFPWDGVGTRRKACQGYIA